MGLRCCWRWMERVGRKKELQERLRTLGEGGRRSRGRLWGEFRGREGVRGRHSFLEGGVSVA